MGVLCAFLIIGDSHGNQQTFSTVVDALIDEYSTNQYSAIIHTGDSIEDYNISQSLINLNKIGDYTTDQNFVITRGNHDNRDYFNDNFRFLPYSTLVCDNNVLLINIDSNREYVTQMRFIERELMYNTENRRVIVIMHHNLITISDGNPGRHLWKEFLEQKLTNKDLIIHGHSHVDAHYVIGDNNDINVICASRANRKRYNCVEQPLVRYCYDGRELTYTKIMMNEEGWDFEIVSL